MVGRKLSYNPIIADMLCEEIAGGCNIYRLAGTSCYPTEATIFRWMRDEPSFFKNYITARETRAHARSDRIDKLILECKEGRLGPAVAAVCLKAEMWQAGREAPKHFGDKIEVHEKSEITHTIRDERAKVDAEIDGLLQLPAPSKALEVVH